ncbi:hypothetical protein [Marinobacter sp. F3R11]|uniref:hypothetical protein n=1 Tax=Marinobacter sp. F3R11 TaxID=2267231 RepID=UPI0021C68918|nr:hypothetical protein [Marinobacter sp. F3R11]
MKAHYKHLGQHSELFDRVETKDRALLRSNAIIEKLTHEVAILKRHKYARHSEPLDAVEENLKILSGIS